MEAGNLRRSDSIRNNYRPGPWSRITVAQKPNSSGSGAVRLRAEPQPPGTEFLDAETKHQKSAFKRANARRDQNPRIESPEIPAGTPYLASCRRPAVCKDWVVEVVGLKLVTHHPVIEPVSEIRVRNGIFRCRDGGSNPPFCLAET